MRKLTAVLLVIVLCLSLPLHAFAATELTLRLRVGEALLEENYLTIEELELLFNSLFYKVIMDGSTAAYSLHSEKGEMLNLCYRSGLEGFYFSSPLVGERTLYFSTHDAAERIKQEMEAQPAQTPEAYATEASASTTVISMLPTAIAAGLIPAIFQGDSIITEFAQLFSESGALIGGEKTVSEGSFTSEEHDPATQKTVHTFTAADLAALCKDPAFRKLWNDRLQLNESTAEEIFLALEDEFAKSDLIVTRTAYTDGEKECAVLWEIAYTPESEQDTSPFDTYDLKNKITLQTLQKENVTTFTYAARSDLTVIRTGENDPRTYATENTLTVVTDHEAGTISINGRRLDIGSQSDILGELTIGADGAPDGWIGLLKAKGQITAVLDGTQTNGTTDLTLSLLYSANETGAVQKPAEALKPLCTVALQIAPTKASEAMISLADAAPEECMQLLRFSEEELEAEMQLIQGEAMAALMRMMSLMPPELLSMMMNPGTAYGN
ncbi:MAG: hypothetical protein IKK08_06095 [Clostridia bacterium]|nr:hypothetical protein [Clostridia bacterium]